MVAVGRRRRRPAAKVSGRSREEERADMRSREKEKETAGSRWQGGGKKARGHW